MKCLSHLFLTTCIVFTFISCQKKPSLEKRVSSNILKLNLTDDPTSLDPRVVRRLKDLTVVKQLFEGLTRLDEQGKPQLAVAETMTLSEDGKTYTFVLKKTQWTDGTPVTAEDFIYAWQKILNPDFASDYSHLLYPIKNARLVREGICSPQEVGFKSLNEKTIVIELENPTPYFLELTAFPTYFPIPSQLDKQEKKWASPPGQKFVCNGPFRLKQWKPQFELVLEKNPLYWDTNEVHLQEIAFTVIGDNTTEGLLFEKGDLDWLGQPLSFNIAPEFLARMRESGKVSSYPVAGTYWFKFNTKKVPFQNVKIRQAFSRVIQRQEIITHLLQGNQTIATGPLPPSMALQTVPYFEDGDLINARALFKEGLAEENWTIESFPQVFLNYAPTERDSKIVQLVQQRWQDAFDITIELQPLENHLYQREIREGHFQVGTGQWIADYNDPISFLELFKGTLDPKTGSGMGDTGWQDHRYNDLLEKSVQEKDLEKRKSFLHEAEKILVEAMPIAPLYHFSFDYAKKEDICDVLLSPLGIADFKKAKRNVHESLRYTGI